MTVTMSKIGADAMQNPPFDAPKGTRWAFYTGKDHAGNNASATLVKGHIVALKAVPTPLNDLSAPKYGSLVVCEAETAYLGRSKFAVVEVPDGSGVAGTGGWILVKDGKGPVQLLLATGVAADDCVFMANGALKATATDPGIGSRDVVGALVAQTMEANASGADALTWCFWDPAVS